MTDSGIYQLIAQNASAIGIAGLWPSLLPEDQADFPAATYREIGGSSMPTFETSGMQRERWQFDFYSASIDRKNDPGTRSSVMAAYWAFRNLIEGYQGVLPDGSVMDNVEHIQRMVTFDDASRSHRVTCELYFYFTLP
jgi:hypothetical protein